MKTERYYSWDIRLASLGLALLFLLSYYGRYHIIGRAGLGANPPSEDVIQEIIYQDQAVRERRKYTDAGTQTPDTSLSIGDQLDSRDDEDCLLPSLSYREQSGGEFN